MAARENSAGSYWHREAGGGASVASEPPRTAEIAIIGAGFAGLSTAIAIKEARPAAEVIVLESSFAGFGASGRNGGLMSPLAAPIWLITADTNPEHAWALTKLNAATAKLARRIATEMPEAEAKAVPLRLEASGHLTSAALDRIGRTLGGLKIENALGRHPRSAKLRTLELTGHTVQPYRLVQGLARTARALGVYIQEGVRVTRVDETARGVEIGIDGGTTMTAAKAVLCTNAYTRSLTLASQPRARTLFNYMIATEQLSPDSLARLHSRDDFTVELNTAYVFYRVHKGRVVLGGIDRMKHKVDEFDVPSDVEQKLGKLLAASLAGLPAPKIAEAWAGRYHATHTELPIVKYAPGSKRIVHNVGYGGTGVALTQVLAPVAAALALGQPVADPDLARLHAAMEATRLPIVAGARAGTAIAWAAARNLIRL